MTKEIDPAYIDTMQLQSLSEHFKRIENGEIPATPKTVPQLSEETQKGLRMLAAREAGCLVTPNKK